MNYERGLALANEAKTLIAPYCERVEIAGGIRRKKAWPHDIELVCIPKPRTEISLDYFQMQIVDTSIEHTLEEALRLHVEYGEFLSRGDPDKAGKKAPFGPKYWRLKYKGERLDIFAVTPPAQFGLLYLIRTGPAEFSHEFVQRLWKFGMRSVDGHIERVIDHSIIATPEEKDAFQACAMEYVEPELRTKEIFEKRYKDSTQDMTYG
jgi:DNA polymerase/3'-5' exonuclease PolX